MKKLLILGAGILLFACNSNKPAETNGEAEKKVKYSDLVTENLKGNIESITESDYKVDSTGKVGEMDSCCVNFVVYDENGNAKSYLSKDSKGNVKNESVFTAMKTASGPVPKKQEMVNLQVACRWKLILPDDTA